MANVKCTFISNSSIEYIPCVRPTPMLPQSPLSFAEHLASSSSLSLSLADTLRMPTECTLHGSNNNGCTGCAPRAHRPTPAFAQTPLSSAEQSANSSGSLLRPAAAFVCTSEDFLHVCISIRATTTAPITHLELVRPLQCSLNHPCHPSNSTQVRAA